MKDNIQIMENAKAVVEARLAPMCRELVILDESGVLPAGEVRGLCQMLQPLQHNWPLALAQGLIRHAAILRISREVG